MARTYRKPDHYFLRRKDKTLMTARPHLRRKAGRRRDGPLIFTSKSYVVTDGYTAKPGWNDTPPTKRSELHRANRRNAKRVIAEDIEEMANWACLYHPSARHPETDPRLAT